MNPTSSFPKMKLAMAMLAGVLLTIQIVAATGKPARFAYGTDEEKKPVKKEKEKARTFTSLNNPSVKIYPDALNRDMHVVAKNNDGKDLDFFVFDLQGTLLHNYKMKAKDHNKISGLAKGTYVYRVFCGDEETAAGKFEIR
ncbi:MAG TPA: T9SS type A sorting domain-containing protein [Chitinophagaceae bacterium]|nr:T9SS type A sorting domain-containing protein [Chitinophagaceae bacterium]